MTGDSDLKLPDMPDFIAAATKRVIFNPNAKYCQLMYAPFFT
jgi:hypothetical protein